MTAVQTAADLERKRLREVNGYREAIQKTDGSLTLKPVEPITAAAYKKTLHEWDLFVEDYTAQFPGCTPSPFQAKTVKDFLLFHGKGSKGRINKDGKITDSSAETFWKNFRTAWQREVGGHFPKPLRDTVLNLINGGDDNILDLSKERRPVKNYTLPDFEAVSRQLWQNDWHDYYHELYRSGLHLLQLLHCGTSGRAGEFEKNLRFRDVTIAQVWMTAQPQIVLDLRRDKAKGLQDLPREQPEHLLYELVGQPFYYNTTLFFMARALSVGALRFYKTWADICSMSKPRGRDHRLLEYEDHCLDMPIFPRCYADGSVDDNLTSSSLASHALADLGYRTGFRESLTFHASRREALLKVDNYGYSINERMRFGAHRHQGTYAAAYQPRISTVDGQATFFELDRQNMRIHELFRGYSLRRDYNFRPTLPESLKPRVEEQVAAAQKAALSTEEYDIKERQRLYDKRRQVRDQAMRDRPTSSQEDAWTSDDFPYESDFAQSRKLMPERDRLAESLFQEGSLRDEVGKKIMDDLVRLLQTKRSQTYCRVLNSSFNECNSCHRPRSNPATWWPHTYRCRKAHAKVEGRFLEFCFLCFQWFNGQESWRRHAATHLSHHEGLQLLPLKCNMIQFRHNPVRPFFCPKCLGDEDSEPEDRFRQFTNLAEWKTHILHCNDLSGSGPWRCHHPRCVKFDELSDRDRGFRHLADIHQISFSVAEREQLMHKLILRDRHRNARAPRRCPQNPTNVKQKRDIFVTYTSRCMKRQIEDRNTRRSWARLKIPCPEGEYSAATDPGHDAHGRDEVDVPVAGCDETKILDDPALPREVESVVKGACTANEPPESAQNGESAVLPSSSPEKRTLRGERRNKRAERPTLLAVVIPPSPVRPDGKKRRISVVNGTKRQANLTIEVPPLPPDWWAWEEIPSPLTDDWLNSSSAMERTINRKTPIHRSKKQFKKQPKKQAKEQSKKRPRGRPRTRHLPTTNNHTQSQPPPSLNLSERHGQKKSASAAEERPRLTRKRKASDRADVLEEDRVEDVPPSHGMENSPPVHLTVKKVRFISPITIFPQLLSLGDQTDVAVEDGWDTPLPWTKDSTTFNLGVPESERDPVDILGETNSYLDTDWAVNETFSSYARDSGETMGDRNTSDFREPPDAADADPNFEALFGQCIRSPPSSPTPSSPPKDSISELSGTNLDAGVDCDPIELLAQTSSN